MNIQSQSDIELIEGQIQLVCTMILGLNTSEILRVMDTQESFMPLFDPTKFMVSKIGGDKWKVLKEVYGMLDDIQRYLVSNKALLS